MIGSFFILLWVVLVVLSLFIPSIALLIYSVLASERDALGIASFFNLLMPQNKLIMRSLLLLSFAVASIHFFKFIFIKVKSNLNIHFLIAYLAIILIVFVSLIKGSDIISSVSILVYSGLPVFIIWCTTQTKGSFRKVIFIFVFIQVNIATCVLIFPALSFIDGAAYQTLEGLTTTSAETAINMSMPDYSSDKGAFARYGHFHNPNALGFYAGVSLIFGIYLLIKRTSVVTTLLGINFFACGAICWLNSLTRGPMIAVFGYVIVLFLFSSLRRGKFRFTLFQLLFSITLALFMVLFVILNADVLMFLIPDGDNASVSWRVEGYINGLVAIYQNPLLGVGPKWEWVPGLNPHMLPITFAADHGIIVGVILTFLVFILAPYACYRSYQYVIQQKIDKYEGALCIGLILSVLSIGLTNNIAATVLFWLCLAEALIRIYAFKKPIRGSPIV